MIHREGITTDIKDWTMIQASSLVQNQEVIQMYVLDDAYHFYSNIMYIYFSNGSDSVEEACQILVDNNISSAPVYVEGEKGHYIGMFDYGDVIAYILLVLHRKPGPKDSNDSIDFESLEIKDIVRRALQGQKVPVRMASGKSSWVAHINIKKLIYVTQIYLVKTHFIPFYKRLL